VADDVAQRARHEEVLLLETQCLPGLGLIAGVQDLRDVLGVDFLLDGAAEVPLIEIVQVEVLRGPRSPEAQRVHGVSLVPHDERVVRDAEDGARGQPAHPWIPVDVRARLCASAQGHHLHVLRAWQLPRVPAVQPVIVPLDLMPVLDALFEDSEVVADPVADGGQAERGQRVHEAGGAAEAAVAEARVPLLVEDVPEVEAALRGDRLRHSVQPEVQKAQAQAASGQELRREIVDALHVLLVVCALRGQPPVYQPIAHGVGQRLIEIGRRRLARLLRARIEKMVEHGAPDGFGIHPRARARPQRSWRAGTHERLMRHGARR
jgi:hypothetical protein